MTNHEHQGHEHKEQASCCGSHADDQQKSDAAQAAPLDKSADGVSVDNSALAELKNEILNSIGRGRRAPLSWNSVTVSVALGLLALISLAQVAQSAELYNKLKSGDLKSASSAPASDSASSLPGMVGGC